MHKLKLLLLVLCSFIPLLLTAQPPGYLGKRASATFNISSLPVFEGPTQNNRGRTHFGEEKDGIGFNYEFELDFSYVVGRYKSLGLKAGQYYTGAITYAYTPTTTDQTSNDRHELFNRVNVRSIGLTYSKFKKGKGALAPIGNRFYYGLKRTFISAEVIDKLTTYGGDGSGVIFGHRPINVEQNTSLNFLTLGWSNNQIFWDRLILKTGIRLSFALKGSAYETAIDIITSPSGNQENFEKEMHHRVFAHELFRLDIGLGLLLF